MSTITIIRGTCTGTDLCATMNTNRLTNAISLFREYEEDIPLGTILCFLHLCDNDEATVSQVEARYKLGKSRSSRNMRNLPDRARPGKAGIDVAAYRPDPDDFRVPNPEGGSCTKLQVIDSARPTASLTASMCNSEPEVVTITLSVIDARNVTG